MRTSAGGRKCPPYTETLPSGKAWDFGPHNRWFESSCLSQRPSLVWGHLACVNGETLDSASTRSITRWRLNMEHWCNGNTSAFQAVIAGSSPVCSSIRHRSGGRRDSTAITSSPPKSRSVVAQNAGPSPAVWDSSSVWKSHRW